MAVTIAAMHTGVMVAPAAEEVGLAVETAAAVLEGVMEVVEAVEVEVAKKVNEQATKG